jgi:hypothetical protein
MAYPFLVASDHPVLNAFAAARRLPGAQPRGTAAVEAEAEAKAETDAEAKAETEAEAENPMGLSDDELRARSWPTADVLPAVPYTAQLPREPVLLAACRPDISAWYALEIEL